MEHLGGAAEHGGELALQGALAQRRLELLVGDRLLFQDGLHQDIVGQGGGLQELGAVQLGLVLVGRGDVDELEVLVHLVVGVAQDELHLDQVDDALELAGQADRDGHDGGDHAELLLHLLERAGEVGADAVELVDVGESRHLVGVGLEPDLLGLHLDAAHGAEDAHRAVEDAEGPLDLSGEIDVAGRVDEGDAHVAPFDGDGGGVDRDALLLLELVEVRGRVAIVNVAGLVLRAAVVQDPLGGRGLARVHMGDDSDVAYFLEHGCQVRDGTRQLLCKGQSRAWLQAHRLGSVRPFKANGNNASEARGRKDAARERGSWVAWGWIRETARVRRGSAGYPMAARKQSAGRFIWKPWRHGHEAQR